MYQNSQDFKNSNVFKRFLNVSADAPERLMTATQ